MLICENNVAPNAAVNPSLMAAAARVVFVQSADRRKEAQ